MTRAALWLRLTLKRKWFDLVARGEKTQEYREIKTYWIRRLTEHPCATREQILELWKDGKLKFRDHIDLVAANNGYRKDSRSLCWKHKGFSIGKPKPGWCEPGDEGTLVFILDLELLSIGQNFKIEKIEDVPRGTYS